MINALHDSNITLLPHWVAVHVPSLERDGTPCKTDWTDKTARFLSSLFGGATVSYTSGYWRLATDKIQNEACSVVSSHAREIHAEDVQKIF